METKLEKEVKANPVALSEDQTKFYDENGYLIVPGVFSDDACETIKAAAEAMSEEKEYPVLLNVHRRNELFLKIAKDPVLVSMIETLQRHKVTVLNDQYLFKKAGTPYARQAWRPHQDGTYVNAKDGTYIQVHIFLVQNEKENGGLYYYAGSHREPKLPYEYRRSWKEEFDEDGISRPGWLIKEIPPQYPKVDLVGPKGGVCFQHGNAIHGSYPNLTRDRDRCQYSIAYLNEGESYRKGEASIKIPLSLGRQKKS